MACETTDAELLRRYVGEGAEDAFAALVDRHLGVVYSAAFRVTGDGGCSQEIAQNVFVTLARRAVWLVDHPSLAGWLYRTAIHLAQHEMRARQRRLQREQIATQLGTTMPQDDSLLSELAPVLDEALLELAENDREALVLRYFSNKSIRDVGASLGVREDAAQKRVTKALERLTERFRRRGFRVVASATILVLQKASAAAPPAGLHALATHAALSAGAAASLGSLALPLVKLMSLTKIQTATLCVLIAAVPLGYEWSAGNRARADTDRLNEQLKLYRGQALLRERDQAMAEQRASDLDRSLAAPLPQSQPVAATPAAPPANLFNWDEQSDFVRLPKSVLQKIKFSSFRTHIGRDGKPDRYQIPPLAQDGTPEPALAAALGLSPSEADRLGELCRSLFSDFQGLAAQHSQLTEEPFLDGSAAKLKMSPFPDEGRALRDSFQAQLSALMGDDRAAAFMQQAGPEFDHYLNGFGVYEHTYSLGNRPNVGLEIMEQDRNGSQIGRFSDWRGMLPPNLQGYADAWARQNAAVTPPPNGRP